MPQVSKESRNSVASNAPSVRIVAWRAPAPSHLPRLASLFLGALTPPPGRGRIALALAFGVAVHSIFAAAVLAMVAAMYFGMSRSFGTVSWPYAVLANAALILQFPLAHSFLLSARGRRWVAALVPGKHGETLGTTTFAIVASLQLLALFALWTPSGIVWWQAEGAAHVALMIAYGASWLLLVKATYDAGMDVQSGALGWLSLLQDKTPRFPGLPTGGLFRTVRHPIYVAFALTLWTVPVWTPDQLALAVTLTAYCLLAPRLKERRLQKRYGDRYDRYRRSVPYAIPGLKRGE
jgi:protein-S-isoprenylcysteine O-methyltransferase Ste14